MTAPRTWADTGLYGLNAEPPGALLQRGERLVVRSYVTGSSGSYDLNDDIGGRFYVDAACLRPRAAARQHTWLPPRPRELVVYIGETEGEDCTVLVPPMLVISVSGDMVYSLVDTSLVVAGSDWAGRSAGDAYVPLRQAPAHLLEIVDELSDGRRAASPAERTTLLGAFTVANVC